MLFKTKIKFMAKMMDVNYIILLILEFQMALLSSFASSDWTVVDDSLVVDCVDASVVLVDPFSVVVLSVELEVVDCVELSVFSDSVDVDPVVDVVVDFSVVEVDVDELEVDELEVDELEVDELEGDELEVDELEVDELEVDSVVDAGLVVDDDDDDELFVDDSGFAVVDPLDDVELPSDVVDVLPVVDELPVDDEPPEAYMNFYTNI